jgi:hypothetical protein
MIKNKQLKQLNKKIKQRKYSSITQEFNCNSDLNKNLNTNDILNPNYVTGITDAEGNFYISIYKDKRRNNKIQVRFFFTISQRDHSEKMLFNLLDYFGCGKVI